LKFDWIDARLTVHRRAARKQRYVIPKPALEESPGQHSTDDVPSRLTIRSYPAIQ
jgi:hypothetical protein